MARVFRLVAVHSGIAAFVGIAARKVSSATPFWVGLLVPPVYSRASQHIRVKIPGCYTFEAALISEVLFNVPAVACFKMLFADFPTASES